MKDAKLQSRPQKENVARTHERLGSKAARPKSPGVLRSLEGRQSGETTQARREAVTEKPSSSHTELVERQTEKIEARRK